jgi:hypothetical protein
MNLSCQEPMNLSCQEPKYLSCQEPENLSCQEPKYLSCQEPKYLSCEELDNISCQELANPTSLQTLPPNLSAKVSNHLTRKPLLYACAIRREMSGILIIEWDIVKPVVPARETIPRKPFPGNHSQETIPRKPFPGNFREGSFRSPRGELFENLSAQN